MLQLLKKMFGMGPSVDFAALKEQGAQIIDVRTKAEFDGGHIKGAVNIPLQVLSQQTGKLKKDKPIITCCASGMRSASAKGLLKSRGFEAYNGGSWVTLNQKLNRA